MGNIGGLNRQQKEEVLGYLKKYNEIFGIFGNEDIDNPIWQKLMAYCDESKYETLSFTNGTTETVFRCNNRWYPISCYEKNASTEMYVVGEYVDFGEDRRYIRNHTNIAQYKRLTWFGFNFEEHCLPSSKWYRKENGKYGLKRTNGKIEESEFPAYKEDELLKIVNKYPVDEKYVLSEKKEYGMVKMWYLDTTVKYEQWLMIGGKHQAAWGVRKKDALAELLCYLQTLDKGVKESVF